MVKGCSESLKDVENSGRNVENGEGGVENGGRNEENGGRNVKNVELCGVSGVRVTDWWWCLCVSLFVFFYGLFFCPKELYVSMICLYVFMMCL